MMDSRHASLGRRTLEEIRQKRAAERLSKASSGPDLTKAPIADVVGMKKSESGNRLSENDISGLVSQLKDMQQRNAELGEVNRNLTSTLDAKEIENDMLQKRVSDLEQNTVPSLRKALRDIAMEKDAAVVAREDLSAQLRTLKKRLKEAEEEQYRAEEDAAALRAEVNSLLQQSMSDPLASVTATGYPPDRIQAMENELASLKSQFEKESMMRQQEQQQLAEEQLRTSALILQKQELEEKLAAMSRTSSEEVTEKSKTFSVEDKEKLEKQLHDMAVAIERLESSRQKLMIEIDSQSSEIERLFDENSSLSTAYQDSVGLVAHWENQVKDCLKQNEELRGMLDKLRAEQTSLPTPNDRIIQIGLLEAREEGEGSQYASDFLSLKGQLAKEQSRAEALSAEVLQLSVRLQQATQAYNGLARLYKPVLRNIENSLIKMKQDGSVPVQ
ncbi:calponin homology domain-containing protein DDB_G0272472 isoform X1 [Olea europaea var. sylvestris]|uniref:calponin homology domain-containing protein DDB_G0272472 isoform X1 n=1 Tax=Olea europaea var. sylvestris TaxID=158386 RepID=UPI000C1D7BA8|nr:calponin homology domain-containing protein DDB_G0272472 isoform X1 [Olea europaea var. sylvestris]XP_022874885.1 calponin homology domain-containing protein DDB_G0272472 isoform X1 [Olea europaea var. sylvestris]